MNRKQETGKVHPGYFQNIRIFNKGWVYLICLVKRVDSSIRLEVRKCFQIRSQSSFGATLSLKNLPSLFWREFRTFRKLIASREGGWRLGQSRIFAETNQINLFLIICQIRTHTLDHVRRSVMMEKKKASKIRES